jgi:hypothetical protein
LNRCRSKNLFEPPRRQDILNRQGAKDVKNNYAKNQKDLSLCCLGVLGVLAVRLDFLGALGALAVQ